jgi:hypothetical protein
MRSSSRIIAASPAIRNIRTSDTCPDRPSSENGRLGEFTRNFQIVNSDVVDFVAVGAQTFIKLQQPRLNGSNALNPKQMFSTNFHKVRGMLWEQVSGST